MAPDLPTPPHLALYRRFRAQTFGAIVGQAAVVETLRNAVRLDRLGHGFLFVGPRGTGKTSMARIVAKAANCSDLRDGEPCDVCPSCVAIREGRALDVVELDAASNNRVDDMRELLPRVYTAPADLRRKVFIIDEVQRIKEGWDVLLKTLEEPPPGVLFIFCTTDPSQIRPAVVSRLQRFTFRPLTHAEITGKLERILAAEGRSADAAAVALVARIAAGGMRDAESILDQVLAGTDEGITADAVRDLLGMADDAAIGGFVDALARSDAAAGLRILDDLEADGRDLVSFADQVVVVLRGRLVDSLAHGSSEGLTTPQLARAARRLTGIDASRSGLGGYRWQLELALLEATASRSAAEVPAPPQARARAAPSSVSPAPAAVVPSEPGTPAPPVPEPLVEDVRLADPEPPAERVAVGPGDDLLAQLRSRWPEVMAHVSRNPANKPLIAACRPVRIEDGVVVLGFPEDQPFLREKAERRRSALEEGLSAVLGAPVGVRCVVANVELADPGRPDADGDLVSHALRIFEGELADVREVS